MVKKKDGYWLYVPWGVKAITIKHGKFGVIRNHSLKVPVRKAFVYELILDAFLNGELYEVKEVI